MNKICIIQNNWANETNVNKISIVKQINFKTQQRLHQHILVHINFFPPLLILDDIFLYFVLFRTHKEPPF